MMKKLLIYILIFKVAATQINGEFWWLNDKLAKLFNVEPSPPKFDDTGEFDTDDSAKIIFRDSEVEKNITFPNTTTMKTDVIEAIIHFRENSKLDLINKTELFETQNNKIDFVNETNNYNEDILSFVFSDDVTSLKRNKTNANNSMILENYTENNINNNVILNNSLLVNTEEQDSLSENICTYMKKAECSGCNGLPYIPEMESFKYTSNFQNICCILPLNKEKSSKISFPGRIHNDYNRIKRSNNERDISPSLKQRKALMQRKYGPQNLDDTQLTTSIILQKIVTPEEEYIDPYLNIKSSHFKLPNKQQDYQTGNPYHEHYSDYNNYYTVELPKPSLVGLYSDHRLSSWSFIHPNKDFSYDNEESVEEEIVSNGYSTIDPRLNVRSFAGVSSAISPSANGSRSSTQTSSSPTVASNFERRLLKPSLSDVMLDSESQTVTYHSNPDYKVLQGFKLLNLKNKITTLPRRTSTTESLADSSDEKYQQSESNTDNDYDEYAEHVVQIYKNCGRMKEDSVLSHNYMSTLGESARGAHPWILLVVLTKRKQSILCYATLVHPRAAVTAADCTFGMSPGDISIVAGVWDLNENKRPNVQYRRPSDHVHQRYIPGQLAYNIAVLYWRRPLRLDAHVQPACVSDVNIDNDCVFVGWGGYDQAIRERPRWQRANIIPRDECDERISTEHELPVDTFCASVDGKTTVTGPGGPLMCRSGDLFSMVGFAVWRDDVVVLMRTKEWLIRAMASLIIN